MVIKGRSRSNGPQLADYLLNSRGNDRAHVLDVRGTAQPDSLRRSLLEMSMSSELTKRGTKGLYHAQINPAIGEDAPMTPEDWLRAADVLETHLGLDGQKRAIVLHEKNGRLHGHVVWERYDHDTGKLRTDSQNFKKHDLARAEIEQEFGHERTPQRADRTPTDKERLTALWQQHPEGASFVQAAADAGYQVVQGNARRPFRVVTSDGQSLDLTRQLDDVKVKAVRDRLQPIRDQLPTEADALQQSKADRTRAAERDQPTPEQSDKFRDLSDSQDRAETIKDYYQEQVKQQQERPAQDALAPENSAAPPLPRQPEPKKAQSDKSDNLSDTQAQAGEILKRFRERRDQQEQQRRKAREMQQQAAEQTKKQEQERSVTDEAAEMLERYRRRQQERGRGRDGPEI